MAEDELSQEILRELLEYDCDTGVFRWRERTQKWFERDADWKTWNARFSGKTTGSPSHGYLLIRIFYDRYQAHRLAWLFMTGEWPEGQIDHVNGDRSDNRFSNLRVVSHAENGRNQGMNSNNTSGFKGVHWYKRTQKWTAKIMRDGKLKHLGCFDSPEDAYSAYVRAASENGFTDRHIFGEAA